MFTQSPYDCMVAHEGGEEISHPMGYYERKLDDTDDDQLVDWRERQESKS